MKVVSPQQMARLEEKAYQEGFSEDNFMEEAGSGIALVIHDYAEWYGLDKEIILLCGKGNNAGDAYVAGIHLLHLDYHVLAYQTHSLEDCSHLCKKNAERFAAEGGKIIQIILPNDIEFPPEGMIVDGLFGTGFRGRVESPYSNIIEIANNSGLPIIAIDIPSGLDGDTGMPKDVAIHATLTTFLGLPKTGFFLGEGWNYAGKLVDVDFGLPEEFIEEAESEITMLTPELMLPLLPRLKRNRHKYEAGYVIGLAGSPGMPGAAMMSCSSALKGGAGMVKLFHPAGMEVELVNSPPELIRIPYTSDQIQEMAAQFNKANAVFIGPGLGRSESIKTLLEQLMPLIKVPCVLDADALNIYSEREFPFPLYTVLTPHTGEMQRLLKNEGPVLLDKDYLKQCGQYAQERGVILVLKGSPTFIFVGDRQILVNPTGDPGMATAGSGDVLTGLLAAMIAQGLDPAHASMLGVYLHGLAGEYAAQELTSYCMTATDIIDFFPMAFSFQPTHRLV